MRKQTRVRPPDLLMFVSRVSQNLDSDCEAQLRGAVRIWAFYAEPAKHLGVATSANLASASAEFERT